MAEQTQATMNVAIPQGENTRLLYNVGKKGYIRNILPELQHQGICVKWTRFSLQQMCCIQTQWNKDMILMCYYLYTYYADLKNISCPFKFNLGPCYLSNEQFQESEARFNGDCNIVTIFQSGDVRNNHHVLLKIYHKRRTCVLYDCQAVVNTTLNKQLRNDILFYLKKTNL